MITRMGRRPYAKYEYEALDPESKQIRLLTILPGNCLSGVRVIINVVELNEENTPKYEALSYVWGSASNPRNIIVALGAKKLATLSVTHNLATALPYLRHQSMPRTMWIDAICINQEDVAERGQQVGRMGDIYSMADRVVAWLGPGNTKTKQAFSTLYHISLEADFDWARQEVQPKSRQTESSLDSRHGHFNKAISHSILYLLRNPWFGRLWVRQELCLAKANAQLQCGYKYLPWSEFCNSIGFLYISNSSYDLKVGDIQDLSRNRAKVYMFALRTRMGKSFGASAPELMEETEDCKFADPRDRVYAI